MIWTVKRLQVLRGCVCRIPQSQKGLPSMCERPPIAMPMHLVAFWRPLVGTAIARSAADRRYKAFGCSAGHWPHEIDENRRCLLQMSFQVSVGRRFQVLSIREGVLPASWMDRTPPVL